MKRHTAMSGAVLALLLAGATGTAAAADTYPPPATGAGKAAPTRVKQGHCTSFSGDGFAPAATVTVYDDTSRYGNVTASDNGDFTSRVCFKSDARVGDHQLAGHGDNARTVPEDPAQREVTATVTVVGAQESSGPDDVDSANAASTTRLVSPFPIAAAGLLLVPVISGLLLLFERRHRRRRRAA